MPIVPGLLKRDFKMLLMGSPNHGFFEGSLIWGVKKNDKDGSHDAFERLIGFKMLQGF